MTPKTRARRKARTKRVSTIYVVCPDYGYDGYGEPEGAYVSEARAKTHKPGCGPFEIIKLPIDYRPAPPAKRKPR